TNYARRSDRVTQLTGSPSKSVRLIEYFEVDTEEIADHKLAAPFAQLAPFTVATSPTARPKARNGSPTRAPDAQTPGPPKKVASSYVNDLVDLTALEPPTSVDRPVYRPSTRTGQY